MAKVLIIATSVDEYEKVGYRTGLWLGELTHFWDIGEESGIAMDIASPRGGKIPIDPESLMISEIGESIGVESTVLKRYSDREFMNRLQNTKKLSEVKAEDYDAIYLTGGHGVMFDFREHELAHLVARFHELGKIVSAVCHGLAGLLEVRLGDGTYMIAGKNITGFSWQEEGLAKRDQAVPYNLEEELQQRGANYTKAAIPFGAHIVEDGKLITGQNPNSAKGVGEAVMKQLLDKR